MSRQQANEIATQIVPLYEADFAKEPYGKPFEEVYDVERVEPTPEWQGMYDEVWGELLKLGLPLHRLI